MNDDVTVGPSSAMQVMHAGSVLSPDVAEHLTRLIALTARRERDRRDVTLFGVPLFALFGGMIVVMLKAPGPVLGLVTGGGAVVALFVSLAVGARNRARLDQAAVENGVSTKALLAAVRAVRDGDDAATALRAALDGASS